MNEQQERLQVLCESAIRDRGLEAYRERLQEEIREIIAQNEEEYLLDLHDRGVRYPENQNNLMVAYLLDIVSDWNPDREPEYIQGEYPDIDIDYIKPVREYLRNEWAGKNFGEEKVCAIGNYTTFGLKSSFIDMARVHGLDTKEINIITKKLDGKDDDGKVLTFDKALELYDDLREYCEHHPDVAEAVKSIVNRNRGMGTHAGGLVVSDKRIDNFVPLVRGKDEAITSAWTEGLHGQDLGPMGLIKFDLLGITDISRIAMAVKLVKERHGIDFICSDPNVNRDWSDTSYLDDKNALRLARKGDLLGIFQFDSPGIRKLTREVGVDCFNDLVALTALYRPGPLGMGMHEVYRDRKNGVDESHLNMHPILEKILGKTYGVMAYQEQIMQILHAVGKIPLKDCEAVRKAISKKQIGKFQKYKDMFVRNGQDVLGQSQEDLENLWDQIEAFSAYGFNLSHSVAYTYISSRLLYLKANYPIEFYAATLSCEKTVDKIKEYKRDAMSFGRRIEVLPVDINRSKMDFHIEDGKIYYGIQDLKGLGEEVTRRVVAGQPYKDLPDFLDRFGTDAKVCNVVIELGLFGMDIDRQKRFYHEYKEHFKKITERDRRFVASRAKFQNKLLAALGMDSGEGLPWDELDDLNQWVEDQIADFPDDRRKEVIKAAKAYCRCVNQNREKSAGDEAPDFHQFELESIERPNEDYTAVEKALILSHAEQEHYGFRWVHPLELAQYHAEGQTFEDLRANEEQEGYVEVLIRSVNSKLIKKVVEMRSRHRATIVKILGDIPVNINADEPEVVKSEVMRVAAQVTRERQQDLLNALKDYLDYYQSTDQSGRYYSLSVEDANSEIQTVNIWSNDWERFGDFLKMREVDGVMVGNLVRMKMIPPTNGFPTYGLKTWRRHEYNRVAPKNVSEDTRVIVLEYAEVWKKW